MLDFTDDVGSLVARKPTGCVYKDAANPELGDRAPILRAGEVAILRSDHVRGLHLRSASVREIAPRLDL